MMQNPASKLNESENTVNIDEESDQELNSD